MAIYERVPVPGNDNIAFVVRNAYTLEECASLMERAEKEGYTPAEVNGGDHTALILDYRFSSRCMIDDPEEANKLFNKIKEHLPEIFQYRKLVGVNERLRFLKYDVGNFFKKHMDGAFTRVETGERSLFTVMLYLNGDMAGGTTRIYGQGSYYHEYVDIIPEPGLILVFQHDIHHEGMIVEGGIKYCIRSDIMYSAEMDESGQIIAPVWNQPEEVISQPPSKCSIS